MAAESGSQLKRIAVILEGRVQYERNVLRGIRDFASKQEDWLIRLELPGRRTADFIESWKPDGVLFQSAGLAPGVLQQLSEFTSAIHLSEPPRQLNLRSVGLDNGEIGRAAATYFRERRFENFAFAGAGNSGFSKTRGDAFQAEIPESARIEIDADTSEGTVLNWLQELPKPCALFSTHDECSLFLTTICRSVGVKIPEEIAILGVDDDTLICELAWPQLSSIGVPSRRVGYEAAERLDRLMSGMDDAATDTLLLPPTGIVTRHSTDVHQTEDETVNRALRLMRSHVANRINVEDVLREIGVSRRLLERKFAHHLGRSPLREIRRLRFEAARQLLLETRLPLHEIAVRCGCGDASSLVTLFRQEVGMTPGAYRDRKQRA